VSPNSARDGYGLGLSIVQRIARLLDIKVEVTSEPGKGSVFAVELPRAEVQEAAARGEPPRAPQTAAGEARHILVVEDEPSVRNAMRMLLEIEGYEVTTTASAADALEALRRDYFDLIVTDYHLESGRTGTEVINAARESTGLAAKAILVTGDTSAAVREMQGDDLLRITSKPINSDELLGLVKDLLAD
jgi:CheY-like chemotaxis protein